jgi:ribosomal protein S27AE
MNNYRGISADDKHTIIAALKARGAGSCPRCSDSQWTVSEYSRIEVQATMDRNAPERNTITAIMIVCENCGFIAQHALQPLGVWPHTDADVAESAPPRAKGSRA